MKYEKQIDQLLQGVLADCLHAQNPTELFNALNRLKLAVEAVETLAKLNVK